MPGKIKSLRFGVVGSDGKLDSTAVSESLKDLWTTLQAKADVQILQIDGCVWAPPMVLSYPRFPAMVILGRAVLAKSPPTTALSTFVAWTYGTNGISVTNAPGLTVGTMYDLIFVVVG